MSETLLFEYTLNLLFGKKAHQIAGYYNNKKERNKWFLKAIRFFIKEANQFDTTESHKEQIISCLECLKSSVKRKSSSEQFTLFLRLTALLLGFNTTRGGRSYSLVYWQSEGQYLSEKSYQNNNVFYLSSEYKKLKKNIIAKKRDIIERLKSDKYTRFEIALIFNTTEYKIKKILKDK